MMTIDEMTYVLAEHKKGKTVECNIKGEDCWVSVEEPVWDFSLFDYRIKPLSKPYINWDHVHPDYKWMMTDCDGTCYLFETKPTHKATGVVWMGGKMADADSHLSFIAGRCDWKDSLVERP